MRAQVASVLGKEFSLEALEALFPVDRQRAQLGEHLQELVNAAFLVLDKKSMRYAFVSTVCHEATYSTLLHAYRRQLHRSVAIYIERKAEAREQDIGEAETGETQPLATDGEHVLTAMQDPTGVVCVDVIGG